MSQREVRHEDAFDPADLAAWMGEHVPEVGDAVPRVTQFTGGVSNLTYMLRYPRRDLILRRPPTGTKPEGSHDVHREYELQTRLKPGFGLVPQTVAYCDDPAVIGSEFFVMERVAGLILRRDMPRAMTARQARRFSEHVIDTWAQLHAVDVQAHGLAGFGRGPGYVHRQVERWTQRYRNARTPNVGSFETVMRWLAEHEPQDAPECVIHNDFRFDNLVLDGSRRPSIIGVLDWEVATVGDPWMDLGSSLAYWVQADDDPIFRLFRRQPTSAPGVLTRAEAVERYAAVTGFDIDPERWRFYEVFGLFRLAVIAQQMYYRYHTGESTNRAFRGFANAAIYLEWRCRHLIGERLTGPLRLTATIAGSVAGATLPKLLPLREGNAAMKTTTLITGASAGLGAEMARQFAAKGCDLALCARRTERLEELKAELEDTGVRVETYALDVNDPDEVDRVFAQADADLGGIERFIANAGVGDGAPIGVGKADANRRTLQTNLIGTLNQCESALALMRPRESGQLVLISSIAAVRGQRRSFNAYAASKAGVAALGEGLRAEFMNGSALGRFGRGTGKGEGPGRAGGIKIQVLYPGYIRSEMNEKAKVRLIVDTRAGVKAMVAAIESGKPTAFVPAWPWVPVSIAMKWLPLSAVRRLN